MKWIAALGLLMQFLSFWLAAPELLGDARLRVLEVRVRALVAQLPTLLYTLAGLSLGGFGLWFGRRSGRDPAMLRDHPALPLLYFASILLITAPILLFQRRIVAALERRLVVPLLHRLIDDEAVRVRALLLAALLMTAGFVLQLAVILLS